MKTHFVDSHCGPTRHRILAAALVAAALLPAGAPAQSGSWSAVAGSPAFWDTASNWSGNTIANGMDSTATFASAITGPFTVALNANVDGNGGRTIGNLVFGTAANANPWTVDQGFGAFVLNLQTSGATLPNINVVNPAGTAVLNIDVQTANNLGGTASGFTKSGAGNLSMTVNSTYTGPTIVNAGTLTTDFSAGASNGFNILPTTTDVTLTNGGSVVMNAGAAQTVSQQIDSLTVGAGTSVLAGTVPINRGGSAAGTGALITATLGPINRAAGGIMVFSGTQIANSGGVPTQGISATTTSTNNQATGGILGGYAIVYTQPINTYTLSGTTVAEVQTGSAMGWASVNASGVILPLNTAGVSVSTANTFTSTTNDDVTTAGVTTITSGTSNSVRFNNGNIAGYTLSLAGTTSTINTGGILETQNVNANTPNTISSAGGSLSAGVNSPDLIVSQFNPYNTLTISAPIVGSKGLTTGGVSTTVISGANTYNGTTNISGGIMLATTPGSLPGFSSPSQVFVNGVAGGAIGGAGANPVNFPAPAVSILAVSAGGAGWTSGNIDSLLANATFAAGSALGIDVPAAGSPFAYNSNIAGSEGLAKTDAGTLTLGGTSTYTGTTTILGGTLSVGSLANSGTASAIGSGSTIAFGGLAFTGPGAPIKLVSAGATLQYTGAATSINRGISLGLGGGTITTTNALTLAGNISGPAGLTLAGGTLTLSGAGSYLGPTTVQAGTLSIGSTSALPAATDLIINNGASVSYANGVAVNLGSLWGSGSVSFGNATTLNVGADTASGVYRGAIGNGSGGATTLVKNGSGIQALTGNNTFSGGLTVNGGTLQVSPQASGANPLGAGAVTLNGPGSGIGIAQLAFRQTTPIGAIGWNQDTIWSPTEATGNQGVTYPIDGANTYFANNVGPTTVGAVVLPPGTSSLPGGMPSNRAINLFSNGLQGSVLGTNAPLAGSQLTVGSTYLLQNYNALNTMALLPQASGTLSLLTPDSYKSINVLATFANGGTGPTYNATLNFADNSTTTVSLTSADWFGTAGTGVIGGLGRYNVMSNVFDGRTTTGFPQLYQQTITLSAGDQLKTLTSITFTNTTAAGGTNVLAVYALNGVGANAPAALSPGNNLIVTANASLEASGYTTVTMGTLSTNASTITVNGTSGGVLNFTGTTLTGSPTISVPTGMTVALGSITDANNGFGITKNGAGTLTISGASNYAGGIVTVNGGTLDVGTPAALPLYATPGEVTLASGTTLVVGFGGAGQWTSAQIGTPTTAGTLLGTVAFPNPSSFGLDVSTGNTGTLTTAGGFTLTAGVGFTKFGGGTLIMNGPNTYPGSTTILGGELSTDTLAIGGIASGIGNSSNAATNLVFANGGLLQYTGPSVTIDRSFTLNTNTGFGTAVGGGFDIPTAGTTLTVSGVGSGSGILVKAGAGTLVLTGSNSYSGGTTVSAGTLQVGGGGTTGVLGSGAITDNGTLAYNLTVAATQANAISGTGGVTKLGTGSLTLSGANSYTGPTTVTAGSLLAGSTSAFGTNSAVSVAGGSTLSLNAFSVSIGSLAGAGTVNDNSTTAATLSVGGDNTSTTFSGLIANGSTGALSLAKFGTGTLTLTNAANTYTGGTTVSDGILGVASDGALGTGAVTIGAFGTLSYSATTTTPKSFVLGNGTLAASLGAVVTLNGGSLSSGYLGGAGAFSTSVATGARFASVTSEPSVTINSNNGSDRYVNFTNGGTLNVAAALASPVTFSGFVNQGSGAITVGQNSVVNVSNFQSYGLLTLNSGTFNGSSGGFTQLVNTGSSKLFFDGGSRTFISTAAQAPNINAGIDLHGNDAVVAGGLLVNNGYVIDSTGGGHRIVADFGAVVKGAGFYQTIPQTINGGTFSTGNSPGGATAGAIVLGGPNDPNLGLSNYTWQINDAGPSATYPTATGTAGPTANAAKQVSGWGLLSAVAGTSPVVTTGNFDWDATPTDKLTIHLTTLLAPNDVNGNAGAGGGYGQTGDNTAGLMSDFDPTKSYVWKLFAYQGTYTGPTDTATLDASTAIDDSGFLNPHNGRFDLVLNQSSQEMDLTFTPTAVPEPGTLSLLGVAGLGLAAAVRRRKARKAAV